MGTSSSRLDDVEWFTGLLQKDNLFKNTFDFTGNLDYVAVVERLPALYYSQILFSSPLESWVSL